MVWANQLVDQLSIPSDAEFPGDTGLQLTTDVPQELVDEGIPAALLGYSGSYDPSIATIQVVYTFIGVKVLSPTTTCLAQGVTYEQNGVRLVRATMTTFGTSDVGGGDRWQLAGVAWDPNQQRFTHLQNNLLFVPNDTEIPNGWQHRGYSTEWDCARFNGWARRTDTSGVSRGLTVIRDVAGNVTMSGLLTAGTTSIGTRIAQLPLDLRNADTYSPMKEQVFMCSSGSSANHAGILVKANRDILVDLPLPATWVWFSGSWTGSPP